MFVGAFIGLFLKEEISQPIEDQLTKLRSQQITEAYYGYTSKNYQSKMSLEDFRQFVKGSPVLSRIRFFSVDNQLIDDNIAIVKERLTSVDGSTQAV